MENACHNNSTLEKEQFLCHRYIFRAFRSYHDPKLQEFVPAAGRAGSI
jgi:hypothetical protein